MNGFVDLASYATIVTVGVGLSKLEKYLDNKHDVANKFRNNVLENVLKQEIPDIEIGEKDANYKYPLGNTFENVVTSNHQLTTTDIKKIKKAVNNTNMFLSNDIKFMMSKNYQKYLGTMTKVRKENYPWYFRFMA